MTTTSTTTITTPASAADDQAAIAAVPARMVELWARHDADAFADLFVEDGTMILPGVHRRGREQIRDFMAAAFAGVYQGTRVTGTPLEIKPLNRDAVVLVTTGGVIAAGESELSDAAAIRASWVLVRSGGGWRLAVYQNSPRD